MPFSSNNKNFFKIFPLIIIIKVSISQGLKIGKFYKKKNKC